MGGERAVRHPPSAPNGWSKLHPYRHGEVRHLPVTDCSPLRRGEGLGVRSLAIGPADKPA